MCAFTSYATGMSMLLGRNCSLVPAAWDEKANHEIQANKKKWPRLINSLHVGVQTGIHYEAVGVIGNLVHSSQHIKKTVLAVSCIFSPCAAASWM